MPINYDEPLFVTTGIIKRGRVKTTEKPKQHKVSLEQALETLKALGFSVVIPTSDEDKVKQDQSLSKLGFVDRDNKPQRKARKPTTLKGYLHACHRVGSASYGPGEIELSVNDQDLFRTLLQQDQACVRAHMDTTQYNSLSRCYLIQPGRSADTKNKFAKNIY